MSGGYGVLMADLLEMAGLSVRPFSPEITTELEALINIPGTRAKNPTDLSTLIAYPDLCRQIFEIIIGSSEVDAVIFDLPLWYLDPNYQYIKEEQSCEQLAEHFCPISPVSETFLFGHPKCGIHRDPRKNAGAFEPAACTALQ